MLLRDCIYWQRKTDELLTLLPTGVFQYKTINQEGRLLSQIIPISGTKIDKITTITSNN
jgi:hypothetical protein